MTAGVGRERCVNAAGTGPRDDSLWVARPGRSCTRCMRDSQTWRLDRIIVRWNRGAAPPDNDPISFKRVEQIRDGGSPPAIPSEPDLDRKSTRLNSSH